MSLKVSERTIERNEHDIAVWRAQIVEQYELMSGTSRFTAVPNHSAMVTNLLEKCFVDVVGILRNLHDVLHVLSPMR